MAEQPLFPLRTVLFPDGLLELKIFEARYLDLMSRCLRERIPFGVVALRSGREARSAIGEAVQLHEVGTLAELIEVDSAQARLATQYSARAASRTGLRPCRTADILVQQLFRIEQVVLVVLLEDLQVGRLRERTEVNRRGIHGCGDIHEAEIETS